MRALEDAPNSPQTILLLAEPTEKWNNANAQALWECINNFRDWNIPELMGSPFHARYEWELA